MKSSLTQVLILETTHRKPVRLGIGVPVDRGIGGIQVPVPGIGTRLERRPEVGVRRAIVERAIGIAVTSQGGAV